MRRGRLVGVDPGSDDACADVGSDDIRADDVRADDVPVAISATVTYDGQACTYAGPAVVPRGAALTFTLVNTPAFAKGSVGAGLFVTPVLDGTTWAQVLKWAETRHVFPFPDWMRIPGTGYDRYQAGERDMGEALSLNSRGGSV